jgi:excinuclease ABC subunit A
MLKSSARAGIRLRGVRQNNLKNFDLDLPLNRLIVVTGLSGSGKSSLAFDTLFAEGQRRYIETFSPYARQFFDRMDKPKVDSIEGIPPAIAVEQRNAVRTTRSTVGTMTEICDYMKVVWLHASTLHCRNCGGPVRKDSPQAIWQDLSGPAAKAESSTPAPRADTVLVTFDLPLSEKLPLEESLDLVARQGYQRVLVDGKPERLEEFKGATQSRKSGVAATARNPRPPEILTVIQDRVGLSKQHRARFIEACEQAYHFGKSRLTVWDATDATRVNHPRAFSKHLHCAHCDIEYREPSPALFSFNHPVGACPTCRGFGRVISIDYSLAIPDRTRTLAEGLVKPWLTGQGAECQSDLMRTCRHFEIPTDVPFNQLPEKWQRFVIDGDPDYGKDEEHEWPRAWYGVKGYFRWLESKAYKMHVRVLLSRYRAYTPCKDCRGTRFKPDTLLYRLQLPGQPQALTLPEFYQLPVRDALEIAKGLVAAFRSSGNEALRLVLDEVRSRLDYLSQAGLGYLTLDRPTRSLSGGETERVNLTTCLGTSLVNTLFILDEPSVGLHPHDTDRLVGILKKLRDTGNTVLVVEHEPSVMRAADRIIDLGPGHGATGGEVVFQGTYQEILSSRASLTGLYLSGQKQAVDTRARPTIPTPRSRIPDQISYPDRATDALELKEAARPLVATANGEVLTLKHATRHNLKDLWVAIPLGRFVCVTGVSGSGKSTLIREVLLPALEQKLKTKADLPAQTENPDSDQGDGESESDAPRLQEASVSGFESLGGVVLVDQSLLGKTPRSNPAVYTGAFEFIRDVFAASPAAKERGLNSSAFSFNSGQGQCERCRGAGFEKIEMQFLSDVFIRCPDCDGRRYRAHILQVKLESGETKAWSIADMLDATADEAIDFFLGMASSKAIERTLQTLRLLQEVGLGYLKLGQPVNTLSGGESQRLKLVRHLAEVEEAAVPGRIAGTQSKPLLFLFDEPTTGLHFDDVRVLLGVFQRLVDASHTVLVIEHNLDVIRSADWIIDMGPHAGDQGGQVVAEGTPEDIAQCRQSLTGKALRESLAPTHTNRRK